MRPRTGPQATGRRADERGAPSQDDTARTREDITTGEFPGAAETARHHLLTELPGVPLPAEVSGFDDQTRRHALKRFRSGG
jgi:hypothetical protein